MAETTAATVSTPIIELLPITEEDLPLYELMFTDPIHMEQLGGVLPAEKVPAILAKQMSFAQSGKGWVYKIYVKDIGKSVGTVMMWRGSYKGEDIVFFGSVSILMVVTW
jgi:hypothetical protein